MRLLCVCRTAEYFDHMCPRVHSPLHSYRIACAHTHTARLNALARARALALTLAHTYCDGSGQLDPEKMGSGIQYGDSSLRKISKNDVKSKKGGCC